MEQKARLENWVLVGNQLLGEIYDDNTGRFKDGDYVRTSSLRPMSMQVSSPDQGVEVFTQNTVYLLGKKYQE
ncbi:hypothetical protein NVP1161O_173 [Vibrio phage 1.161.O._10N.261.48.C5]|nr:hypothetical protein NVP1161O_173 [Vibrio phage 1.161.O._10N.261.48.C5]